MLSIQKKQLLFAIVTVIGIIMYFLNFIEFSVLNIYTIELNLNAIESINNLPPCYLSLSNMSSTNHTNITHFRNFKIFDADILNKINCRINYCNIVSVFGSYCNQFTLYWFHRLLYSHTFLSTKIPKFIFISINNINGSECVGDNNKKYLYQLFLLFLNKYFNIHILIYFHDEVLSASKQRNFLTQKINEFFMTPSNNDYKQQILEQYNSIIVSWFDADDIITPQRFEYIDYIYSNKIINGSILHKCSAIKCRNPQYFDPNTLIRMYLFLDQLKLFITDRSNSNHDIFKKMYAFHIIEANELLKVYQFERIDIEMKQIYHVMSSKLTRDILINKYHYKGLNSTNYPFHEFAWIGKIHFKHGPDIKGKSYSRGGYYANGWPITSLQLLLNNPFDINMTDGEDIMFNFKTVLFGYDYYLFPIKLGIYCVGDIDNKISEL